MSNTFSQEREAIELTKRSSAIACIAAALRDSRFTTALVLRMHRTESVGRSVASLANVDDRRIDQLHVIPGKTAETIVEATRIKTYDLIIAGFELHHVTNEEEFSAAQAIGDGLSPGGVFLTIDYALPTGDPAQVVPFIRGARERQNVDAYGGIDGWLPAHAGWSVQRMANLARNTERRFAISNGLPAYAGIAASSDDLETIDVIQRALADRGITRQS